MKIAIYHPNLNTYGGGETVALTISSILSKEHDIDIFTPYLVDKKELEKFFGLKLGRTNIVRFGELISKLPILNSAIPSILLRSAYKKLEKYDLVIDTCTNGWFDKKLNTKTVCYIHYPFFYKKKKGIKSIINHLIIQPKNAFKYDVILCNSNFTKGVVSKMTNKKIEVLYPPVEVEKIKPRRKSNRIVTVGRFTYDKKHEVMIEAFKELCKEVKDYSFHLIGSFQKNTKLYKEEYLNMLLNKAKGYPIELHINMPHNKVLEFLEESKIYWHARGYGETDLNEYESFGITTVEAMAAGCIPIVINLGAQPEIIKHNKDGYCWNNTKNLLNITKKVIFKKAHTKIMGNIIKNSKNYSSRIFSDKIISLVDNL